MIREGIIRAIAEEFGENFNIYAEIIRQDLQEPCFLVQCISQYNELTRGNRYEREEVYIIQYFPESYDTYQECDEVASRLFDILEVIKLEDGQIRGQDMRAEMGDEVLRFSVRYKDSYFKPWQHLPPMERHRTEVNAT